MAQKDANLIDESQVKEASGKPFLRLYGECLETKIPATEEDLNLLPENNDGVYLFGVSREFPLDGKKMLPKALAEGKIGSPECLELHAQPGEYLVFQIVVWSKKKRFLANTAIQNSKAASIESSECFLNSGIDFEGKIFRKPVPIIPEETKILWCAVQIKKEFSGTDTMTFQLIENGGSGKWELPITLHVSGEVLEDGGISDDFRMARLKWLNSFIGLEHLYSENNYQEAVPEPWQPLRREGNTVYLPGHAVIIGDDGLPEQIRSGYCGLNSQIANCEKELFDGGIKLSCGGITAPKGALRFFDETPAEISWSAEVSEEKNSILVSICGTIYFNGKINLYITTRSKDESEAEVKVEIPFADAPYMLGLGVKRPCTPPEELDWHWNPAKWEDSFWAGNINNGCIVRLKDHSNYEPLLNCYYEWSPLQPPECWNTEGQGGIKLKRNGKKVNFICYSGSTAFQKKKQLAEIPPYPNPVLYKTIRYGIELRLTPFHPVDHKQHWNTRFFHPHMHSFELGEKDCFTEPDFAALRKKGVNCINIHHAIALNPIINYPFTEKSLPMLQAFVKRAHEEGFKVLIYYTSRELTVHAPEFKALYSLEGEVFFPWQDNGKWPVTTPAEGPDPWFKQHLDHGFLPAWTEVIKSGPLYGTPDRSLITSNCSRLENFYLEGLRFLLERCPIDGLYLDDCNLSETGMVRLRRIFRKYRGADPILDFHAWESFNSAYSVPLRDMKRFPYLTRLWLGEGVKYDLESYENWLIRLSGLPFGLTSEMLGKGNPYLGLLFGMTNRYGWGGDPCELWKIFDRFGIKDADMQLDAQSDSSFGTDSPEVHVTLWKKPDGSVMAAVGSWSEKTETVHLKLPEELRNRRFIQPEIADFQKPAEYSAGDPITIEPKKGVLLFLI
ncbi:MAG: hypothetical protein IJW23_12905 [Lentisphaeria bacterium]|nr:hypothetical protein [Lentisphaeria bacterium]